MMNIILKYSSLLNNTCNSDSMISYLNTKINCSEKGIFYSVIEKI